MLNQVIIVGRLVDKITLNKNENGKKYATITLAIPRNYKNEEGVYETDFIACRLWGVIAEKTNEYCEKGDLISVRGRLESRTHEVDNEKKYITEVIAEKVSFLSSGQKKEEE